MRKISKLLVLVLALVLALGTVSIASAEVEYGTVFDATSVVNALVASQGEETQVYYHTVANPEGRTIKELKIWGGFGWINTDNFNDSEIQKWKDFKGIGNPSAASDRVASADSPYMVGMQMWQWTSDKTQGDAFIILTAVENCYVEVTSKAAANQWATNMVMTEWVADPDGILVKVREEKVRDTTDPHGFFEGVHLKAGDRLIIQNGNGGYGPGTNQVWPKFEIFADQYDETKRADFEAIKEVKKGMENAKKEIDDYVATLNEADYTSARWSAIGDIVLEAKAAISDATTVEAMNTAVADAKAEIDAVPTKAEEEAELQKKKDEKKAELAAEFNPEHYTKKNWELVQAALDKAYAAIDAAKNVSAMNTAMTVARSEIALVEVGGCGTTKQAEAGIVLGGLAAAIVVFTKKREN